MKINTTSQVGIGERSTVLVRLKHVSREQIFFLAHLFFTFLSPFTNYAQHEPVHSFYIRRKFTTCKELNACHMLSLFWFGGEKRNLAKRIIRPFVYLCLCSIKPSEIIRHDSLQSHLWFGCTCSRIPQDCAKTQCCNRILLNQSSRVWISERWNTNEWLSLVLGK